MLFSKPASGYYIEISPVGIVIAKTSGSSSGTVIESIITRPREGAGKIMDLLKAQQLAKKGSWLQAVCGVYPDKRILRRMALDPKRYAEPTYLNELITTQLKIEPEKYSVWLIDAKDGCDFDLNNQTHKDGVFAALSNQDIEELQRNLLDASVYPQALEMGSIATMGALLNYQKYKEIQSPTLVLEIDADSTQAFILSGTGLDSAKVINQGLSAMVPVVQKELGLKDEESARKLFFSNTFDFTGLGPTLIKKLLKELQSSIGFYEVQTGQSIGQVICTLLPPKLGWLDACIARELGVGLLKIEFVDWLKSQKISLAKTINASDVDMRALGVISLILNTHATDTKKAA